MPKEATYWIRYNSIFVQLRRATLSSLPSSSEMVLCGTFRRYSPSSLLLFSRSSVLIYRIPFSGSKQEGFSLISALDLRVCLLHSIHHFTSLAIVCIYFCLATCAQRGEREIKPIPKTANRSLISSSPLHFTMHQNQ